MLRLIARDAGLMLVRARQAYRYRHPHIMSGDKRNVPQDKPEVMPACDRRAGLLARAVRTAGAIRSAGASLTTSAQPHAIPCGTLLFELVWITFSQLRELLVELTMQGRQSL
jgi:hypothetical protein